MLKKKTWKINCKTNTTRRKYAAINLTGLHSSVFCYVFYFCKNTHAFFFNVVYFTQMRFLVLKILSPKENSCYAYLRGKANS